MRVSNVEIKIKETKEVEVTTLSTSEDFIFINEMKSNRKIEVGTVYLNEYGNHLKKCYYTISGELYDLLMSDSPNFAPNKPCNEYRENDLWHIIELIRAIDKS